MSDIDIRVTGSAGRITLTREKALNALSYDMCMAIDAALKDWATNDAVKIVVIDASGEKAFCAGGDIKRERHRLKKRNDRDIARENKIKPKKVNISGKSEINKVLTRGLGLKKEKKKS